MTYGTYAEVIDHLREKVIYRHVLVPPFGYLYSSFFFCDYPSFAGLRLTSILTYRLVLGMGDDDSCEFSFHFIHLPPEAYNITIAKVSVA